MKLSRWNYLYLNLLMMMAVMMAVSFLPEHFHAFFGDWKCDGNLGHIDDKSLVFEKGTCYYRGIFQHEPTWHWGFRHWIFFAFGLLFTIISIVRIVDSWERRKP
jgi:hypothetical protein